MIEFTSNRQRFEKAEEFRENLCCGGPASKSAVIEITSKRRHSEKAVESCENLFF
jgi:hypothetical protein